MVNIDRGGIRLEQTCKRISVIFSSPLLAARWSGECPYLSCTSGSAPLDNNSGATSTKISRTVHKSLALVTYVYDFYWRHNAWELGHYLFLHSHLLLNKVFSLFYPKFYQPLSRRSKIISSCPTDAAEWRGVHPQLSLILTWAFISRRSLTISTWADVQAQCKAVRPPLSTISISFGLSRNWRYSTEVIKFVPSSLSFRTAWCPPYARLAASRFDTRDILTK